MVFVRTHKGEEGARHSTHSACWHEPFHPSPTSCPPAWSPLSHSGFTHVRTILGYPLSSTNFHHELEETTCGKAQEDGLSDKGSCLHGRREQRAKLSKGFGFHRLWKLAAWSRLGPHCFCFCDLPVFSTSLCLNSYKMGIIVTSISLNSFEE